MSMYPCFSRGTLLSLTTLLAACLTAATQSPLLGGEAARLDGFTQSDGTSFFALQLKPSAEHPVFRVAANGPREVVILVDTAASQTGDYRTKSLDTLKATLARLTPEDRVKLVAFDNDAVTLTPAFVAPNSPQMESAVKALEQRAPLGSCDLEKALDTAVKSFSGDSKTPRAAIYIGDGSSRANLLTPDQLDKAVNNLVVEHVPMTTFGIGPRPDAQVLGTLAARTGGNAMHDSPTVDAGAIGASLADAVRGTVVWPKADITVPAGTEIYPKPLPPLRGDRETVLVGSTKASLPKQIAVDLSGGQVLTWQVPDFKSEAKNGYLASLVDQAKVDGGHTLPLVDADSLANAKREIEAGGRGLNRLAEVAVSGGQFDKADQLADEALRRNPNDLSAKAVKDAVAKKANGAVTIPLPANQAGATPPLPAKPPAAAEPGDLNLQGDAGVPPPQGAVAENVANNDRAAVEALQKKVDIAINTARKQVAVNPDLATQIIQQQKLEVSSASEPTPEEKDRMLRMLDAEGKHVEQRKVEFEHRRQQLIEDEAARREREMVLAQMDRDKTKVHQLFERFDALMAEGRYKLAEEAVGMEAKAIVDRVPLADVKPDVMVAVNASRFQGAWSDILAVRTARQRGFVDALFQVEKSHVPTADEPPIVYPDSEWWKEMSKRRKEKYGSMDLKIPSPTEKNIQEALKAPTPPIEFVETPLKEVVEYLKDAAHIEIQLDAQGLKDAGVDPDTQVTKNLRGISLRSALKLLLDELQLKYVVHNEVLLITSPQKAESDEFMTTKVYPVADLVLPIQNNNGGMGGGFGGMGGGMGGGFGGGMGGMGGMGGGMGGMGGGMGGMGGGFGGMGGGMGGMGGGGGGGFWNVPREVLPRQNQGLRLFAVQPEKVATVAAPVPEAVPANAAPAVPHVDPIHLKIAPGADVRQAWENFFAERDPQHDAAKNRKLSPDEYKAYQQRLIRQQQAVLETVQALKEAAKDANARGKRDEETKKLEEIIALIEAALRHDQAQPWMYELLAMSMKAAGRPEADIERAIMSAAEFTQNSSDLMYLGAYLVQAKMERQALKVFRAVAQVEPFWTEPYVCGMAVARQSDDLAGLEWSTSGIIGQAWPPAQAKTWDDAMLVAAAKLDALRKQQRNEEADRFQAAINQALVRDCVVRVQWTGDADIDVIVKEPGGTTCSLRNPRTTGGGMLVGDMPNPDGKEKLEGHTAVYSCPKGFSGQYQVLIRRVFGNVPTGNVKVIVNMHCNTPQGKETVWEKIPVKDGESLVKFDLADGRRKESLRETQIVNAAVAALGVRQQQMILAQQLAQLNDPNAANALAVAQQNAASAGAAATQQVNPLAFPTLRGAVGYSPVITLLPEGTNMSATGVVSADRRYVRITCYPYFSAISQVHTFNVDNGNTQNTPGIGTGGQGFSGGGNGFGGLSGNGNGNNFGGGGGIGGGGGFGGGGGGGFF